MTPGTTKFDVVCPSDLLTNFDEAVKKRTGMKHARNSEIREMMREYVKKQGVA